MMRTGNKSSTFAPPREPSSSSSSSKATPDVWEVRPCGMLVQKRSSESAPASKPAPAIRVRVKHGSAYHDVYINSQATFGELKKMLSGPTGLHPLDQKILYKDKERASSAYLDTAGVKDRSKLVVLEDLDAQAKRRLEMRRSASMEKASNSISHICAEVDKLASKVSSLEANISKGKRVAETDVLSLIEMLMNELLKLDAVVADGDVKVQRRMQVRRVQKYVEMLDVLKVKNSRNMASTMSPEATSAPPDGAVTGRSSSSRVDQWELF